MSEEKKTPFHIVDVEEGKKYYCCTCGQTKNPPFCDGAHKGTEFKPNVYEASKTGQAYLCGCGASKKGATCDGSHKELNAAG